MFRLLRKRLACTQPEMADILGVSRKAVESYDQGWRKVPDRVLKQLFTLLDVRRRAHAAPTRCYEVVACPEAIRRQCLCGRMTDGELCWAVASSTCRATRAHREQGVTVCIDCPVIHRLLT